MTHLTNYIFDGARAELSKTLSQAPAFQVTHSFLAGSQTQTGISPGTYSFGALYATSKVRSLLRPAAGSPRERKADFGGMRTGVRAWDGGQ